jgi:hypothetical protein
MMPPKEKAKNLLDKMNVIHYVKLNQNLVGFVSIALMCRWKKERK